MLLHLDEFGASNLSQITDSSGGGSHGTLHTDFGTNCTAQGKIERGLRFFAGQTTNVALNITHFTDRGSLALWVRREAATPDLMTVFASVHQIPNSGVELLGDVVTGKLVLRFADGTSYEDKVIGNLPPEAWLHVVITWDVTQNQFRAYVNGGMTLDENTALPWRASSLNFALGTGTSGSWEGSMDEFAYWERALTASEVSSLYTNQQ